MPDLEEENIDVTIEPNIIVQPDVDVNQATTVDLQTGALTPELQQAQDIREAGAGLGDAPLLRAFDEEDVFAIGPDGEKRLITDPEALRTLGRSFSQVQDVAPEILRQFTLGKPIDQLAASIFSEIQFQQEIQNQLGLTELQDQAAEIGQDVIEFARNFPALVQDERDRLTEELDVAGKSSALKAIDEQIANFDAQTALVSENITSQGKSIGFIQGELAAQQRTASIQRTALFAKRAAVAGDFDRAQALFENSIDDFLTSQDMQFTLLQTTMNIEKDRLDAKGKLAADTMIRILQTRRDAIQQQRADKETISALNLTYPFAGIVPGDDLQTAEQKVVNFTIENTPKEIVEIKTVGGDLLEVRTDRVTGELISSKLIHTSRAPSVGDALGGFLLQGFADIDTQQDFGIELQDLLSQDLEDAEIRTLLKSGFIGFVTGDAIDDAVDRAFGIAPAEIREADEAIPRGGVTPLSALTPAQKAAASARLGGLLEFEPEEGDLLDILGDITGQRTEPTVNDIILDIKGG